MTKKTLLTVFAFAMLCINAFAGNGKIVFSKTKMNSTADEKTFDINDRIYCRMYLEKNAIKYCKICSSDQNVPFVMSVTLDGMKYELGVGHFNPDGKTRGEKEGYCLNYMDNDDNEMEKVVNEKFAKALNDLPVGLHKVKVEIFFKKTKYEYNDASTVEGEFSYDKKANSKIAGLKFDDKVKAQMSNPALEAKALKILQDPEREKYREGFMNKYKLDVIKIKIISEDWRINKKQSTGVITGRAIEMAILVKEKGQCLIKVYTFEQQYNGSGYQDSFGGYVGETIMSTNQYHPWHNKAVDCE